MFESEQRTLMLIDEPARCRPISTLAAREGWRTLLVRDAASAIAMLASRQGTDVDAVGIDIAHVGDDASVVIAELRSRRPEMPIVALTSDSSRQPAIEALRCGATDFLLKPVSGERLVEALRAAGRRESWGDELALLSEKPVGPAALEALVGAAPAFRAALAVAAKTARGHGTVLIEGEPGVGKEMLARAMHAASPRARTPLRAVNAGCVPASSLESQLFGHEKDAFPGAFDQRVGLLQHCDGGTLVIDEVEKLGTTLQERLLDFMRRGGVRPIGASHSFRVDVRVIALANCRLRDAVERGQFLGPLLATLAPATVWLPPLRDRSADIPALAEHFLTQIASAPGLRRVAITDEALALLAGYDWPGNVRQLHSALFRAAVFCEGDMLDVDDFRGLTSRFGEQMLAAPMAAPPAENAGVMLYPQDGNLRPLEEIEGDVIRLAIGMYRGRMTEVARRLGIGRSTLYRKLSGLGIDNAA